MDPKLQPNNQVFTSACLAENSFKLSPRSCFTANLFHCKSYAVHASIDFSVETYTSFKISVSAIGGGA